MLQNYRATINGPKITFYHIYTHFWETYINKIPVVLDSMTMRFYAANINEQFFDDPVSRREFITGSQEGALDFFTRLYSSWPSEIQKNFKFSVNEIFVLIVLKRIF